MSDWRIHFEPEVLRILGSDEFNTRKPHHFGRPFVSAYQLAVAFERDNRALCQRLNKVIGEIGEGRDNLERYLAQQLSSHFKDDPVSYPVEAVWLSGTELPGLLYRYNGEDTLAAPNGEYGAYSLFRLRAVPRTHTLIMTQFSTVSVPSRLNLPSALAFAGELAALPPDIKTILFDFSHFSWAEPFGMLVVAQAVQQFIPGAKGNDYSRRSIAQERAESYAAHMGFFEACEFHFGKALGKRKAARSICRSRRSKIPSYLHGSDIEQRSLELAQKLTQRQDGDSGEDAAISRSPRSSATSPNMHSRQTIGCARSIGRRAAKRKSR